MQYMWFFFPHLLNIARVIHTFLCIDLPRQTFSLQKPSQQTTKSVDFRMFSHKGPVPGSGNTWPQRPDRTISVNTNIALWPRTTKRYSSKLDPIVHVSVLHLCRDTSRGLHFLCTCRRFAKQLSAHRHLLYWTLHIRKHALARSNVTNVVAEKEGWKGKRGNSTWAQYKTLVPNVKNSRTILELQKMSSYLQTLLKK